MRIVGRSVWLSWFGAGVFVVVAGMTNRASSQDLSRPEVSDPFPLPACVVLGTPLAEDVEVFMDEDREVRFCCPDCVDEFNKHYYRWIGVIDDQLRRQQMEFYPLKTCVVDGKPLDGLGAFDFVFRNRLFRLCGAACRAKLERDPEKYFQQLNKAVVAKQKPDYPLTTCIVSKKKLGKDAIDYVVANQLVRLANSDQIEKFNEMPGKYLLDLREAVEKKKRLELRKATQKKALK